MKRFLLFLLILTMLSGCAAGNADRNKDSSRDYVAACFSAGGFSPVEWESSTKDFFQGDRYILYLDAEKEQMITVYEYPSPEEAAADLACLDEDGFSYSRECQEANCDCAGFVLVEWSATPHFYLYENLILQYIGDGTKILQLLESNFGAQIAGGVSPLAEVIDVIPMVMINGKYYYSTGRISQELRCGNMDGSIEYSVEPHEKPQRNGESNFGAPYGFQYGSEGDTIEICIDGEWVIFEHRSGDGSQVLMDGEWLDAEAAPATHDNWGLHFSMRFTSTDTFEMVFDHDPQAMTEVGELTTSPEYMVRLVRNGETATYMDEVFAWDTVLYNIVLGGETVIDGDFRMTYGSLPPDQYVLCKPVQLRTVDGEVLTKIYTAQFAAIE